MILEPPPRHGGDPPSGPITLDSLGNDPLILVPDQCGLTTFTVDLFADNDIPLHRYPGEAASYQALEEWTQLGLGAALLPVSKLSDPGHRARELQHNDQPVLISYEAAWRKGSRAHAELAALSTPWPALAVDVEKRDRVYAGSARSRRSLLHLDGRAPAATRCAPVQ